jgi:hypothetical protein
LALASPRNAAGAKTSITTIEDFVSKVTLEDVICFEDRARAINWTEEQLKGRSLPEVDNSLGVMTKAGSVLYRFRVVYADVEAEYVADWGAQYTWPASEDVSPDVLQEFAERVAFFTTYPFLRASVYGSASRLNKPIPVLPIILQGQFERGEEMSPEQVAATFEDNQSELI